jgi:hypothetical protein
MYILKKLSPDIVLYNVQCTVPVHVKKLGLNGN